MTEYTFSDALEAQHQLQINSYGKDPASLTGEERAEFIRWNILAAEDELHEALAEVGWKPWATSRPLNYGAFKGELVDAFHFFMNLMLVAGITADEFLTAYQVKREKNAKRQIEGYDGVTGKCKDCGRALDDAAVECTPEHCAA